MTVHMSKATIFSVYLALVGCASLGLVNPSGFTQNLAAGYQSVTTGANLTGALLDAGKINAADASNVHEQLTTAKESLDIADALYKQDPKTGEARLTAVIVGLDAVIAYLQSKQ